MAKGLFRVSPDWYTGYQEKRKNQGNKPSQVKKAKKAISLSDLEENIHQKALDKLIVSPEKREGKEEHYTQVEIFNYFFINSKEVYYSLYAIPNGDYRSQSVGARLKAEGVKRGVPDMSLDIPRGIYHGLKIELKVGKNRPSKDQIQRLNSLSKYGYMVALCYSSYESIELITKYMNLSEGESLPPQKHENLWRNK